jgi:hypothetical protein
VLEPFADTADGLSVPTASGRRLDLAFVQFEGRCTGGHTRELDQDGAQHLGPRQRGLPIFNGLSIGAAELHASRLGGLQREPRALADDAALAFGQRSEQVQQERVGVGPELHGDERHLVHHEARDEVHVAAQAVELGDHDRRLDLAGGLDGGGKLGAALQGVCPLAGFDLRVLLADGEVLPLTEPSDGLSHPLISLK